MAKRKYLRPLVPGLASIIYIILCGWFGANVLTGIIGWSEGARIENPSSISHLFVRYDSGYYLSIAEHGYKGDGQERAFFPLYPVIARQISESIGMSTPEAGLLISLVCFLLSGLLVYKWVGLDHDQYTAELAVLAMYTFPMAFFFVAFYAEPLLLLATAATLYFARKGQFIIAGLMIAIAGITRGTAIILSIPYFIEFIIQRDYSRTRIAQFCIGAILAPIGFIIVVLELRGLQPDDAWLTYFTWPWNVFYDGILAAIAGRGISADWFSRALVWHDLGYAVAGLVLSIWSWRKIRSSATLFLLFGVIFLASSHGPYGYAFWSFPRRLAVLVPLYLSIALILNRWPVIYRVAYFLLSTVLLGLLSAWFASGRWVA